MNIHFETPNPDLQSIIKIIGIGGGGNNAVNYMNQMGITDVDFINCNTDLQVLKQSSIKNIIQLGPQLTEGLGAGARPEIGKKATEESIDIIKSYLELNTKMVFVTAGMGGGTGTGGTPVVAKLCKELGLLTVVIVTRPFSFEGPDRIKKADEGIELIKKYADALIVVDNEKVYKTYGDLPRSKAFAKADDVVANAANCILNIISKVGYVNVDFNDVNTVIRNAGHAILGYAEAEGEDRALQAAENALNSPLIFDNNISGAKNLLLKISSSEGDFEHKISEINIIQQYVREKAGNQVNIIWGDSSDNKLEKKISVTIIAAGFETHLDSHPPQTQNTQQHQPTFIPSSNHNPINEKIRFEQETDNVEANATKGHSGFSRVTQPDPNEEIYYLRQNESSVQNQQINTESTKEEEQMNTPHQPKNFKFVSEDDFSSQYPQFSTSEQQRKEEDIKSRIKKLHDLSFDIHQKTNLNPFENRSFSPVQINNHNLEKSNDYGKSDLNINNENQFTKDFLKGKNID